MILHTRQVVCLLFFRAFSIRNLLIRDLLMESIFIAQCHVLSILP